MKKIYFILLTLSLSLLSACGGGSPGPAVIVVFGDSLTENKGEFVTPSQHWTVKLKEQITAAGLDAKRTVTVINEGIGGETTGGGLNRLPGVLAQYKPTHIILTHGTNDIPPFCCDYFGEPQQNLEIMAELARKAGAKVIMAEFTLRAYGGDIANGYTNMYQQAAKNSKSTYVNLVKDTPYDGGNYFPDGIHFRDASQDSIKNSAASALFPLLD